MFDRLGMYVYVCIARAKSRFTNAFRVEINKVQGETNNAILYLGSCIWATKYHNLLKGQNRCECK